MKYFIQLIFRKEHQARKFIELHSEIWIISKPCQTNPQLGKLGKIFKMKFKCIVNVGELVAQILVYIPFLPV